MKVPSIPDIAGIVTGAKTLASTAVDLAMMQKTYEAQQKLAELQMALVQISQTAMELVADNQALRDELRDYEQKESLRANVRPNGETVMLLDPPPDRTAGPYCLVCWQEHGKLYSLMEPRPYSSQNAKRLYCPVCQRGFTPPAGSL